MKKKFRGEELDIANVKRFPDWSGDWLVMRCAEKKTMWLVSALLEEEVRAWTPLWVRMRRFPRSEVYRKVLLPCLPSFIFLADEDVARAKTAREIHSAPSFSLMRCFGAVVRIKDRELEPLRKVVDLKPRKSNPIVWPDVGDRRRVVSGAFQGLVGVVLDKDKQHCLMQLEGDKFPPVKIPPFLLSDIGT